MSFLEGYVVGRALSGNRPYRKAEPMEAVLCYGGGAVLGLGLLAAFTGDAAVGWLLVVAGALSVACSPLVRSSKQERYEQAARDQAAWERTVEAYRSSPPGPATRSESHEEWYRRQRREPRP